MREFIDGNTATVRAAVDAGCRFFAGYPITPATSILLEAVRCFPALGGVAIQAEDEIASIGMCLAASMAGKKVMTATSGPGMSLYSETIGLAIMGEVPMVIVNTQRMGPATGGATTSADGDVQFARWGTSGGYPLVVLAPEDVQSTYVMIRQAFNISEKYRVPVIVLSSKEIALTRQTVDLDLDVGIEIIDREPFSGEGSYLPYGISAPEEIPAFSPLGGEQLVRFTTSIHDERGIITGDKGKIDAKLRHLEAKIHEDAPGIVHCSTDIEPEAETMIVAYGIAATAARDAVCSLRAAGESVSLFVAYTLWPIPEKAVVQAADMCRQVIVPEHNLGQYAREIERILPGTELRKLNRIDGGLITPEQIIAEVRR